MISLRALTRTDPSRVDSLFFNEDGTIQKVIPTLRGVGVIKASDKIQIDRYSGISEKGTSIAFHDTLKRFDGWKTIFESKDAWLQYNSVDFGSKEIKSVNVRASSKDGCTLQIHLNKVDGPIIAEVKIPKSTEWKTINTPLLKYLPGIHNLIIRVNGKNLTERIEVDWISFE